jgi:hypothetical protein
MKTTQALEHRTEEDGAAACRERVTVMLDQISREAKQALAEAEIALNLFFLVNSRGSSILTFGTVADPPDQLWDRVCGIVSAIVQRIVGIDRVELRELAWATTDSAEPSTPLPAPAAEPMAADCP